jgi:hypothetical protein
LNGLLHKEEKQYYVGLELICKKTLKNGCCTNGTYQIIDIDDNIFTLMDLEESYIVEKETIKAYFDMPYARTCHSYQGLSENEALTIFDLDHYMTDNDWVYTAITRTTDLNNIYIYDGKYPYKKDSRDLKIKIQERIQGHLKYDIDTGKEILGKYITLDWVLNKLKNNKICKYCHKHFDTSNIESFSIDRKDNNIGHIEMNCQLICRRCNNAKK